MKIERYLSQEDAATLSRLTEHLLRVRDVRFNCAEQLIDLLRSSILLPDNVRRDDCVALYSEVTIREVGASDVEKVFLACPREGHDGLARVSILTPLALALLGRPRGAIAEVSLPTGQARHVEILDLSSSPS